MSLRSSPTPHRSRSNAISGNSAMATRPSSKVKASSTCRQQTPYNKPAIAEKSPTVPVAASSINPDRINKALDQLIDSFKSLPMHTQENIFPKYGADRILKVLNAIKNTLNERIKALQDKTDSKIQQALLDDIMNGLLTKALPSVKLMMQSATQNDQIHKAQSTTQWYSQQTSNVTTIAQHTQTLLLSIYDIFAQIDTIQSLPNKVKILLDVSVLKNERPLEIITTSCTIQSELTQTTTKCSQDDDDDWAVMDIATPASTAGQGKCEQRMVLPPLQQ